MIRSMTAFGTGKIHGTQGTLQIDLKCVNNRFLDVSFRMPESLRFAESELLTRLKTAVKRGKLECKLTLHSDSDHNPLQLDTQFLAHVAQTLEQARQQLPELPTPNLHQLLEWQHGQQAPDEAYQQQLQAQIIEALEAALSNFQAAAEREGARLGEAMLAYLAQMKSIVDDVDSRMESLIEQHEQRIQTRLKESLTKAFPQGFEHISGQELSMRIAAESQLFATRSDVQEEITRLRAHIEEMSGLLTNPKSQEVGKRLDFLCQELNREANTLGSKSTDLAQTNAAVDLKLLIEQLREQCQNLV